MKNFESEDISLFEELYTGLKQAIEFAQGTRRAKITFYNQETYSDSGFEAAKA